MACCDTRFDCVDDNWMKHETSQGFSLFIFSLVIKHGTQTIRKLSATDLSYLCHRSENALPVFLSSVMSDKVDIFTFCISVNSDR